jgi:hypothetical protein
MLRVRVLGERCKAWGGGTSSLCVSWAASWKAEAASSCSAPAAAMLFPYVAVAAFRTCSWALLRGAESMVCGERGWPHVEGCMLYGH